DSKISSVVDAIQKIISGRGISPEKELDAKQVLTLRRLHLFLVLNTKLDIQEKLTDDIDCGHIVNCAPNISKDLLIELVDRLSLHPFLYETIIYSPLLLGVELIDVLLRKIDSLTPFPALKVISGLSVAIYTKYIKLHGSKSNSSKCAQSKLFTYFKTLLQCFMKLNIKKLSSTSTDELYRLAGFAMKSILALIISCLKLYLNLPEQKFESCDIYDIKLPEYNDKSEKQTISKEMFVTELLALCKANCCSITVDVWLFWEECDIEIEKAESKSLQSIIAEAMYVVCQLLKEAQQNRRTEIGLSDEILSMFSSMAVKPRDEDDEIKEANLDLIMSKVSSGSKSKMKWFKAFMEKEEIFTEEKCIHFLENNLQLTDQKDVKVIFEKCITVLNSECNKEKSDRMKNIALEAVRHLSLDLQLDLVQWYFEKFGLNEMLMKDNFKADITELFNKTVKTSEDKGKALTQNFVAASVGTLYCPLLVMLAQIIEACRWNLLTFSVSVASVCDTALVIVVECVLPTFLESKTEEDKEVIWLQNKLSQLLTPHNKSYFSKMWTKFDRDWAPEPYNMETLLFDIMQNDNFIEENKEKILPLCTKMEWTNLPLRIKQLERISTTNTEYFVPYTSLLVNSLLLLLHATEKDDVFKNDAVLSCLDYCIRNFGNLIKMLNLLIKMMHVMRKLPPSIMDSCSIVMVSVLVDMTHSLFRDHNTTESERYTYVQDILTNIGGLGNGETVQVLSKKLLECMEE
ncbi:hypothetical protein C0J52_12149, partial [Blattella germanica]